MTKRFAIYARVSTEDQQDPAASLAWQKAKAAEVLPPEAEITAVFFDIGESRSLPWERRSQASDLLDEASRPSRRFDAVAIGEPHRAFHGAQFQMTLPVLTHYGVELWVPEVGGRVDPESDVADLIMSMFGSLAKSERARGGKRVKGSMRTLAAIDRRWMGGRPPYGYRLVPYADHPNRSKAADGKKLNELEVNPVTAPVVLRIFEQFVSGKGLRTIVHGLNDDEIPSPSASDPGRNRHRALNGGKWCPSTVRSILANPVYKGRRVWGKQERIEILIDLTTQPSGTEPSNDAPGTRSSPTISHISQSCRKNSSLR